MRFGLDKIRDFDIVYRIAFYMYIVKYPLFDGFVDTSQCSSFERIVTLRRNNVLISLINVNNGHGSR